MMLGLYNQCRMLSTLPDPGALLDQRADYLAYFSAFAVAEAEYKPPTGS